MGEIILIICVEFRRAAYKSYIADPLVLIMLALTYDL